MTLPEGSHSDWHVRLRRILDTYFDRGELETLCFDLRFDFEELPGVGKSEKVVELIKAFSRMGRIEELIDYCSQLRPNVPWAELRDEAVRHPFVVEGPPERREPAATVAFPANGASAHRGAPPPPPTLARRAPDDVAPSRSRRRGVWVAAAAIVVALLAVFGWCAVSWTTCPWEPTDVETTDGGESSPEGRSEVPVLLYPPNGTEFHSDPKPITLTWRAEDVSSYTVEIDCLGCCLEGEWCTDVDQPHIIEYNVYETTFTLEQPGSRPLRWRVWAVDRAGVAYSKSDWSEFQYVP